LENNIINYNNRGHYGRSVHDSRGWDPGCPVAKTYSTVLFIS
jgi:hypothetical protein